MIFHYRKASRTLLVVSSWVEVALHVENGPASYGRCRNLALSTRLQGRERAQSYAGSCKTQVDGMRSGTLLDVSILSLKGS